MINETRNIGIWRTLIYEDTVSAPSGRRENIGKRRSDIFGPGMKNSASIFLHFLFFFSRDASLQIKAALVVWWTRFNMKVYRGANLKWKYTVKQISIKWKYTCKANLKWKYTVKKISFQGRDFGKLPWILSGSVCKSLHVCKIYKSI